LNDKPTSSGEKQPEEILQKYFHFSAFRSGQEEIIRAVLDGRDTLGVMPTGSGKSLCYQLPALMLPGLTLVVSPLIALMKDQVDALTRQGIRATLINSSLKKEEAEQRLMDVRRGKYKLLYIAPERFNVASFMRLLSQLDVSLLAVDEAHCISQWGHDFRPSYLKIKNIIRQIGRPPIVALTATATRHVQQDIIDQLEMNDPVIIVRGFDRPNLKLFAVELPGEEEKQKELVRIISSVRGTGIVYVATQKAVTQVCEILQQNQLDCVGYHAGMDKKQRTLAQNRWLSGDPPIIVATNAFGMGIDKADVRFVLHYNIPGSVEAYYQEAGRAGRDGKTSYCVLFFSYRDHMIQQYLIDMTYPSEELLEEIYEFLFSLNRKEILMTYAEIADEVDANEMQVASAIKLFERYGILSRMNRHRRIFDAQLLMSAKKAKKAVAGAPVQKQILDYLLTDISGKYDLDDLLRRTGLTQEQFNRAIKQMAEKGVLHYSPPFRGRGIVLTSAYQPWEKVPIDFKEYQRQYEIQLQRLEEIENYVRGRICRRKYILDYFGEKYDKENCGACDVCLNWRSPEENVRVKTKKDDMVALLEAVLEFDGVFGINRIAGILHGDSDSAGKWHVENSAAFGALSGKDLQTLRRLIYAALKQGYLNRTTDKYPRLEITDLGMKYLADHVLKSRQKG